MGAMFATLGIIVVVAVLQVALDARARRFARHELELWLHMEAGIYGPVVCDQDGRRLRGVRHLLYHTHHDSVDALRLEVLAHDGDGYIIAGRRRRKGPRP